MTKKEEIPLFHDYHINVSTRTIYMGSIWDWDTEEAGTDFRMSEKAIKNLLMLDSSEEAPINIILNTPGGDVTQGYAIYDAISTCHNWVNIIGIGQVMSMGSIIFQAGDSRTLMPNSTMLLHYGQLFLDGHPKDVENWVKASQLEKEKTELLYLNRIRQVKPKISKAALKQKMQNDWILTPQEAVEWGLADKIHE